MIEDKDKRKEQEMDDESLCEASGGCQAKDPNYSGRGEEPNPFSDLKPSDKPKKFRHHPFWKDGVEYL